MRLFLWFSNTVSELKFIIGWMLALIRISSRTLVSKELFGTEAPKKKRIKAEEEDQKGIYWLFLKACCYCRKEIPLMVIACYRSIFFPSTPSRLKSKNTTLCTLFENNSKWRIWNSEFWHFPTSYVLLKLTCLVTLFDRNLQVFKNLPKWTVFGIFN